VGHQPWLLWTPGSVTLLATVQFLTHSFIRAPWGIADMFLAALGVFVGIPTLIHSVVVFYERRRT
jgi:hypothetical protein